MGFFNKIKTLMLPQEKTSSDKKNYESLGIIKPFTALENEQMRSFIWDLSEHKDLRENERKAFKSLWNAICPDQNERNKKIFLVYVSEDISQRLFKIFRDVETKVLELKRENQLSKYKYGVDTKGSKNTQLEIGIKQIEEKDKG